MTFFNAVDEVLHLLRSFERDGLSLVLNVMAVVTGFGLLSALFFTTSPGFWLR
jgi:hypothetical protein